MLTLPAVAHAHGGVQKRQLALILRARARTPALATAASAYIILQRLHVYSRKPLARLIVCLVYTSVLLYHMVVCLAHALLCIVYNNHISQHILLQRSIARLYY